MRAILREAVNFGPVLPSSLQISIVTYRPNLRLLERALHKLELAIGAARAQGSLQSVHLALIDNSEDPSIAKRVFEMGKMRFDDSGVKLILRHGHANIGYGAAHNLVLHGTGADYHLVMNPDVEVATDAPADGDGSLVSDSSRPDVRAEAAADASLDIRPATDAVAEEPGDVADVMFDVRSVGDAG